MKFGDGIELDVDETRLFPRIARLRRLIRKYSYRTDAALAALCSDADEDGFYIWAHDSSDPEYRAYHVRSERHNHLRAELRRALKLLEQT